MFSISSNLKRCGRKVFSSCSGGESRQAGRGPAPWPRTSKASFREDDDNEGNGPSAVKRLARTEMERAMPKDWIIVAELPRNSMGKVSRTALAAALGLE